MNDNIFADLTSVLKSKGHILIKEIGRGATARCYLTRSEQYEDTFAVKVIPLTFRIPNEQETTALMRLSSPNVIYLYDIVHTSQYLYLFLEHCSGGSLMDAIKQNGPLNGINLQRMCRGILDGLIYIHERHFAHLDLKPANVLIDRFGRPKLADFGLSQSFSPEKRQTQQKAGTLCYIAPEMLESLTYDPFKADIWAFGITCYVLAFGRPPWEAESPQKLRNAILTQNLNFPQSSSQMLVQAIRAMLTIDPNERPTANQCLNLDFFKIGSKIVDGFRSNSEIVIAQSGACPSLKQISGSLSTGTWSNLLVPLSGRKLKPRLIIPTIIKNTIPPIPAKPEEFI